MAIPNSRLDACEHALAGRGSHRCPTCNRTMRRCCDSAIGEHHLEACNTVIERRLKEHVAVEDTGG